MVFGQTLAIRRTIGDRAGEGTALNNLSQIYQAQGDYATALDYLQQALAIRRAIDDRAGEGQSLNNLSQIYQAQGDYATALDYLQQSLTISRALGNRAGEGATLNNIVGIYQAQGDYATALDYLCNRRWPSAEPSATGRGKGLCSTISRRFIRPKETTPRRCTTCNRRWPSAGPSVTGRGKGPRSIISRKIYQAQGDYATALDYLQQALAIQRALGDRAGLCATLFNIGHIYLTNKESQQALVSWVAAYRIAKEIGLAEALRNLDNLAKQLGGTGLEYWEMLAQQSPAGEDDG